MPTEVQDVSGDVSGDSALQNAIAALKAKIEGAEESSDIDQAVSRINTALDGKEDKLTFDSTPSEESTNPVTSSGIHAAIGELKENLSDVDENQIPELKSALIAEIKNDVDIMGLYIAYNNWNGNHQYIKTDGTSADVSSPVTTASDVRYIVAKCKANDRFIVTSAGGSASRAYAFIDSDGVIIDRANGNATITDKLLIAPSGTSKLIVNDTTLVGTVLKIEADIDIENLQDSLRAEIKNAVDLMEFYTDFNNWSDGNRYIKTDGTRANVSSPIMTESDVRFIVVNCSAGDKFVITASGGGASRAYAFVDSEGVILKRASENAILSKETVTAPASTAKLIVNDTSLVGTVVKIGRTLDTMYEKKSLLTNNDDLNSVTSNGVYRFTSSSVPSNAPADRGGLLSVMTHDTITFQIFAGSNFYYAVRLKTSGMWSEWSKKAISASGDMNSYTGNGIYSYSSGTTNAPVSTSGGLLVVSNYDNQVSQIVTDIDSHFFYRYRSSSNVWTDWVNVNFTSQITAINNAISVLNRSKIFDIDFEREEVVKATVSSAKKWNSGASYESYMVDIRSAKSGTIEITAKSNKNCIISFLDSNEIGIDQSTVTSIVTQSARQTINAGATASFNIPARCKYVCVIKLSSGNDYTPVKMTVYATADMIEYADDEIDKLRKATTETVWSRNEPEILALRAINSDANGRDIPQTVGILNAYKKAHQLLDLKWTALEAYPKTETPNTYNPAGEYTAVPYSSVKEYNKFVGFNVQIRTFMTAAHNPYSLLYTEDTLSTHKRTEYGIDYNGENCGPYYGDVCSSFLFWAFGEKIPWTTDQYDYLEKIGKIYKIYDQSANGVRLMDMVHEPGHTTIVTDIIRDGRGNPVTIYVSEYGPDQHAYTPEEFNERLSTKTGVIYCYRDLYKNLEYVPSEFVAVENEEEPEAYAYNDDICTYAGDYACFNNGEDVYINYNAGNYTAMQIYKGSTLVNTISINASQHSVKITTSGYGKYKARLTDGTNYSDYTYFEILDTTLTASYSDGMLTINFSSQNSTPVYAELITRAGFCRGFIDLDEYSILKQSITVDPVEIVTEQLPGKTLGSTIYVRVLFKGDYGMTSNPFYSVSLT